MKYRKAEPRDLGEIQDLLNSYQLPASDCKTHLDNFVIAEDGDVIVGVGGFERYGQYGLLRSFAVKNSSMRQGIAAEIFSLVSARAIDLGVHRFYLLTTTASGYFERLGFSVCERERVPSAIKGTKQFNEFCPKTAKVMIFRLST